VIAKISQETLTEVIGTPGSRVLFFMNKLRKWIYRLQEPHQSPPDFAECGGCMTSCSSRCSDDLSAV
jgi:hypothetical protein